MTLYLSDVPPELIDQAELHRRLVSPQRSPEVVLRYGPKHGTRLARNPGVHGYKCLVQRRVPAHLTYGTHDGSATTSSSSNMTMIEYLHNGDYTFPDLVPVMTPGGRR